MARSQHRSGGIIVGVDAGGTWVRVRAQADSRPIAALTQSASALPELATFLHSLWLGRGGRGDRGGRRVVGGARGPRAARAGGVARALRLPPPGAGGGAGGVMGDRWFAAGVRRALARTGLRAQWRESGGAPVDAAVR